MQDLYHQQQSSIRRAEATIACVADMAGGTPCFPDCALPVLPNPILP